MVYFRQILQKRNFLAFIFGQHQKNLWDRHYMQKRNLEGQGIPFFHTTFFFSKIDKILFIQLLRSYFILVLDISYSQKSLQWEMPENKIIYLKLNKNYKLAVIVQGNPRNSGFEHHVVLYVPVSIEKKTFCNQGNLTHSS